MAVSDQDVMGQLRAGQPTPAADASASAGPAAAPPSASAPGGAPMATPEPRLGNREGAMVNLGMALDLIEQSIMGLGSESPEGKLALAAMSSLSKLLGPRKPAANELQPQEVQQLIGALPQGMGPQPGGGGAGAPPTPTPAPGPAAGAPPAPMAA